MTGRMESKISNESASAGPRDRHWLFSVEKPRHYLDAVGAHFPLAFVSGLVLLVSYLLPGGKMIIRTCGFFRLTGYPCPFCGVTRSFSALAHGMWNYALTDCPLGILLYGVTALVFAWNAAGLLFGVKIHRGRWLCPGRRVGWFLFGLFVALTLANWLYRLALGLK